MMDTATIEFIKLLWMVITSFAAFGAWIYAWLSHRRTATLARVAQVEGDVLAISGRVSSIEKDIQYGPSQADINVLHGRISDLDKSVNRLTGGIETWIQTNQALHEQVSTINKYLLSHK
jgi:hypothetical protein